MDIFEKEIHKETVFQDRNVLSPHYVPDELPFREKEIEKMMKILAPSLSDKKPNNIFIYGKTGTGKTSSTKYVIKRLEEVKEKYNRKIKCFYLNCNITNTKYQVLHKLVTECYPTENFLGFPASYIYDKLKEYISTLELQCVVVLDEIDKVKDIDDLLYSLTRINDELTKGGLSIIGITNNVSFKRNLDPRALSTLCEEEIVFPPYNAEQLTVILKERCEIGFKPSAVDDSAINLAAALAAQESGDARYVLKLILKAGEIADENGDKIVTDKHVLEARKGVEEEIVYELISSFPEHQKIVLYAIATLSLQGSTHVTLKGSKMNELMSGEVYERYVFLCKNLGKEPRSARWFREYLNELEMQGLIITAPSGPGIRGNTTLIKLSYPAEKVKKVIEEKIFV